MFKSTVVVCIALGIYSLLSYDIKLLFNKWLSINNLVYTTWILLLVFTYYQKDLSYFKKEPSLPYFFLGIFLYNCATIFVFPAWKYIISRNNELESLIPVHAIFNTLLYLFLFVGLLVEIRYVLSVKKQSNE